MLSKVSVCEPGGTRGSCVKIIRSLPGSVAIIGFTGELNSITRLGGFARFTCATKWTETFPMNNRRELSRNATGAPRNCGSNVLNEARGTRPRPFSNLNFPGRSKSLPRMRARAFSGMNSLSAFPKRSRQLERSLLMLVAPRGCRISSRSTYSLPSRSWTLRV